MLPKALGVSQRNFKDCNWKGRGQIGVVSELGSISHQMSSALKKEQIFFLVSLIINN